MCAENRQSERFIVLSNDFAEHRATYHSWTALSSIWEFKYTHVNSWVEENPAKNVWKRR